MLGCIKDVEDKRDYLAKKLPKVSSPPAFSEKDYSDVLTSIKNQGNLGSCVGFAVTAVAEFYKQKEMINPTIDLSEMWTYWKAKEIDQWPDQEGTSIRDALKILLHQGIPLEKYWVYNDQRTADNKPTTNPSWYGKYSAAQRKIAGYYRINNLEEMYNWLDNYGPCIAGIECTNSIFNTGSDGMVTTPTATDQIIGGHAIAIVEYDRSEHYIGFKNSWAKTFGDLGFGYLDVDYYDNGFFMDVWGLLFTSSNMIPEEIKKKEAREELW